MEEKPWTSPSASPSPNTGGDFSFPDQSFPKAQRLCSRKAVSLLFSEGKSVSKYPFRLLYRLAPWPDNARFAPMTGQPVQILISVPKRTWKRAHDRNALKRQCRETWRKHRLSSLLAAVPPGQVLHIGLIYTGREIFDGEMLAKKLTSALQALIVSLNPATAQ